MVKRKRFQKLLGVTVVILALLNLAGLVMIGVRLNEPKPPIIEPPAPGLISDTEPPIIAINGEPEVTLFTGQVYRDAGATASDNADPVTLETSGEVDTNTPGTYYIKYQAVDFSGNHTIVKRKVTVINKQGNIYLTFDDGPGEYTAALLDILKKYGVKATFFITNRGDDALIAREYNEGHAIGSHTGSHDYAYIYRNTTNFLNDLNAVKTRIQNITGYETNLMRFPGGSSNLVSRRYDGGTRIMTTLARIVTNSGWAYFDWNVNSGDADTAHDSESVYQNVINGLKYSENVVLQHDIKGFSVDAVEKIIQYGLQNGYEFKRLEHDSYGARHGINN